MTEIWKDVPGFEGAYQVSDQGRVRSLDRYVERRAKYCTHKKWQQGRLLPLARSKSHGYCQAFLQKEGGRKGMLVHRIVMAAFIGPAPLDMEVCHNDGDKSNNALANLRYDTRASNHADKRRHGTSRQGEKSHLAKLTQQQAEQVRAAAGTHESIASSYPISRRQVGRIKSGECWA